MSIDPTTKEKEYKITTKVKFKRYLGKLTTTIWYLIILFIVVQVGLIGYKMLAGQPNERMCFDRWSCFDYCELAKQKVCVVPDQKDTGDAKHAWNLLLTGKRNIIEILNDNQAYCGCEITVDEETRIETFYKFYSDND